MKLFRLPYYETLFKEYFYRPIPTVLFAVLLIAALILFRRTNALKHSDEKTMLKRITLIVSLAALMVLFLFCRRSGIRGIRIVHYWIDLGTLHDKMETYIHGFLADLLIFIPVGYLVRWQRHSTHWFSMIFSVAVIGGSIELLQFFTMHGCIGVSDLIAYLVGGICGIYLCQHDAYVKRGESRGLLNSMQSSFERFQKDNPYWVKVLLLFTLAAVTAAAFLMIRSSRTPDMFDLYIYLTGALCGAVLSRLFGSRRNRRSHDNSHHHRNKRRNDSDE